GGLLQHNTRLGDVVQQPAVAVAAGVKRGLGDTAARIGADATIAQALNDVPDAGMRIARAAAELTDPNLSQQTRISLARSRALEAALGDRRTPDEIAASHVIEGDALTEASRPSGVPADAHGEALTGALVSAAAGEPIPEPVPAYSGEQAVANRIIRIESGGDPTAHAKGTSASGLGQFTDQTWLRLYKQSYGAQGKSDADILALKTDPSLAREMTGRLVGLNVSMLQREDLPVTDGNLYLAHFLGPRATRVLHADPSTPVEHLLPAEFIEKNPRVLAGKTAGEVADWADRLMGGDGHVEPLSQPGVSTERQTAAAQDPDLLPGFDEGVAQAETFGDPFGDGPFGPVYPELADDWNGTLNRLAIEGRGEVPGALQHEEIGAIDVPWGQPDVNGAGGHGLAHILIDHPEMAQAIQDLPAMLAEMRVKSRSPNRAVLESDTHKAVVRLTYDDQAKRWLLTAYERKDAPASADYLRAGTVDRAGSPDRGAGRSIGQNRRASKTEAQPLDVLSFLAEHGGLRDDEGHDLQGRGKLISGAITGQRRRGGSAGMGLPIFAPRGGFLFRRNGMSIDEAGELLHEAGYISGDRPTTADVLDLLASSNSRPIYRPDDMPDVWLAEQADRYADPHAAAVHEQVQSLEHDIRMDLAADPKLTVQIDGAGDPISVARLLEDLDADDKALAALKACTVPGGAA
ncbi:MAG: hypothetical protein ACTHOJ_17965, partial [Sphingomonas oligoaromativorans]